MSTRVKSQKALKTLEIPDAIPSESEYNESVTVYSASSDVEHEND